MFFFFKPFLLLGIYLIMSVTWSAGVVPQSTLIIVEEKDGEGNIDIKNTDSYSSLLITKIENIEEDLEDLLVVYPPVARIDANALQTVRFILTSKEPIKTERFKRVIFEGIPPKNEQIQKEVNVIYKQNLPIIIRPAGLAENKTPWESLIWEIVDNKLIVSNPSPYIVRFSSTLVNLQLSKINYNLPQYYILPNQKLIMETNINPQKNISKVREIVEFYPATLWGFAAKESYKAFISE